MAEQTTQEWLESRVRDAAHLTARQLRRTADEIDRLAKEKDLDRVPGQVVNAFVWGIANANPDGAATQLGEYIKAERAGHFNTDKEEDSHA